MIAVLPKVFNMQPETIYLVGNDNVVMPDPETTLINEADILTYIIYEVNGKQRTRKTEAIAKAPKKHVEELCFSSHEPWAFVSLAHCSIPEHHSKKPLLTVPKRACNEEAQTRDRISSSSTKFIAK